jgi:hypothetical protein
MTRLKDIRDVVGLLGGACLAVGIGMFDVRVALITVGALLLSLAIMGAWRART